MYRLLFIFIFCLSGQSHAASGNIQGLESLIDDQRYREAAERGKDLLRDHAGEPQIEFLTALALQMSDQESEAEKRYRQLIRLYPDLPEPRNNLAMILLSRGDYDGASELLVDAIYTHRSYATAFANLNNIYAAIASEAYRRAVSESTEPTSYAKKIELTAVTQLDSLEPDSSKLGTASIEHADDPGISSLLIERIRAWAQAWSEKNLDAYLGFYSPEHRPGFATHDDWVAHRKQRIQRAGFIKIGVSDIQIRAQTENLAIVDIQQSFDSLDYSDRVIKRLGLSRIGDEWKIIDERVLSKL